MLPNIKTLLQGWTKTKETLGEVDQQQMIKILRVWTLLQKWVHGGADLVYLRHRLIILLAMN